MTDKTFEEKWKEAEEGISDILKPVEETMMKVFDEINGKYMNYETCRMLEESMKAKDDMWLVIVKKVCLKLHKERERSKRRHNSTKK